MKNIKSESYSHINKEFLKVSLKIIYEHKSEFEEYLSNNQKLLAVKSLKEYATDVFKLPIDGLKKCKDVMDLYFVGDLPSYIKEERKLKLEILSKTPLIEQIIFNFKNLEEDYLKTLLLKLSIGDLLLIDDIFSESFLKT